MALVKRPIAMTIDRMFLGALVLLGNEGKGLVCGSQEPFQKDQQNSQSVFERRDRRKDLGKGNEDCSEKDRLSAGREGESLKREDVL